MLVKVSHPDGMKAWPRGSPSAEASSKVTDQAEKIQSFNCNGASHVKVISEVLEATIDRTDMGASADCVEEPDARRTTAIKYGNVNIIFKLLVLRSGFGCVENRFTER
ncbi:hypothetical protein Pmar_PMAR026953 [Perkinsus marinus ATCC 50983]|uniref:Uncharacterized protein n=1 Tax=Perkinsus marinus (strain ATCC 50983 / TXsc) TaxID=423536 RepID=C5KBQ4_PERM5|nr:hypothetical protein Pmar_PMAR026953 [Perkinsus marinus ATCC 50983]EER18089.1 hypothetical protein Pmar_PMAR026953 [Perkinsus marinus ATCC 50983]|eukprot:XP_002786293.1 hypothetical protein Pmar_PMAR026953 [Perkinsus marinus ATCC 50983]